MGLGKEAVWDVPGGAEENLGENLRLPVVSAKIRTDYLQDRPISIAAWAKFLGIINVWQFVLLYL